MSKKEIIKTIDIASFLAAIAATILVIVFQFTGSRLVMKYSIIMYAVCFLALIVLMSFKVHSAFSKKETEETDAENSKKQKIWAIVWLVLASVAFAFTCVLLALY